MQILKLIIGVLTIIVFTKIGVNKAKREEQIYLFFNAICSFCTVYSSELKYSKKELKNLLNKDYGSSDFNETLKNFILNSTFSAPNYLTNIEKDKLRSFFSVLGKGDSSSQQGVISSFFSDFTLLKDEKYKNFTKFNGFYKKLGFYVGLIMLIMVI